MSEHDGLLTFQIRETVFLPPDQAGIGDVKELELLPDVEIIGNEQELSITGCLRLHGTYAPARAPRKEPGEADGLAAAMKFSPFTLEEGDVVSPLPLTPEEGIHHRIPLNITVPRTRIAEMGDVYAVVDHFDYELKGPRELTVQGVLKIIGIRLDDRLEQAAREEAWEYVHTVNMPAEPDFPPTTIDELERKLAQLEREVEEELKQVRESGSRQADVESQPAHENFSGWQQPEAVVPPGPMPSAYEPPRDEHPSQEKPAEPDHFRPTEAVAKREEPVQVGEAAGRTESSPVETVEPSGDPPADVPAVAEKEAVRADNVIDLTAVLDERAAERDATALAEAAGGHDGEAEPAAEAVSVQTEHQEPEEEQEVRVAISSKPAQEKEEPIHLSSLFANAGRVYAEQMAAEQTVESSSSSNEHARASADDEAYRRTLEVMNTLSSVASSGEEQFSKLRMCIAQRHDTLEKIAERYALPVSRLMEVNNLSSDRLEEGQVLYIPL